MDDKMYLTATAQGEVKGTGGRAEEKLGARLQRIGMEFGFFGVLSIFYGVSASFCLFRNPLGITVPLFVAVTYGAAFLIFRKMGVPIKKDSYLLAAEMCIRDRFPLLHCFHCLLPLRLPYRPWRLMLSSLILLQT